MKRSSRLPTCKLRCRQSQRRRFEHPAKQRGRRRQLYESNMGEYGYDSAKSILLFVQYSYWVQKIRALI